MQASLKMSCEQYALAEPESNASLLSLGRMLDKLVANRDLSGVISVKRVLANTFVSVCLVRHALAQIEASI
jgi:hypothetical protein